MSLDSTLREIGDLLRDYFGKAIGVRLDNLGEYQQLESTQTYKFFTFRRLGFRSIPPATLAELGGEAVCTVTLVCVFPEDTSWSRDHRLRYHIGPKKICLIIGSDSNSIPDIDVTCSDIISIVETLLGPPSLEKRVDLVLREMGHVLVLGINRILGIALREGIDFVQNEATSPAQTFFVKIGPLVRFERLLAGSVQLTICPDESPDRRLVILSDAGKLVMERVILYSGFIGSDIVEMVLGCVGAPALASPPTSVGISSAEVFRQPRARSVAHLMARLVAL